MQEGHVSETRGVCFFLAVVVNLLSEPFSSL